MAKVAARRAEIDQSLYGGTVTAPKELVALQADAESLQRRQRDLEDHELDVMEQVEAASSTVEERAATGPAIRHLPLPETGKPPENRSTNPITIHTVDPGSGNVCPVDDGAQALVVGVAVSPDDVAADHAALFLVGGVVGAVEGEVAQCLELGFDPVQP